MTQERTMPPRWTLDHCTSAYERALNLAANLDALYIYAQSVTEALASAEERVKELKAKYLSAIGADSNV